MTLTQVSVLQVFITARLQVSAIKCGTTFSMFLTLIPSVTHASLELRENFEVALNLFNFIFFCLHFYLKLTP